MKGTTNQCELLSVCINWRGHTTTSEVILNKASSLHILSVNLKKVTCTNGLHLLLATLQKFVKVFATLLSVNHDPSTA